MNLYDISEELLNFKFMIDEETGEILNINELDNLKMAFNEKAENIIKYIIAIIVIIMILNLYGVNTTSIIASLGAVSVIIGLAFQDIIKDFLAGVFIIFDNEYDNLAKYMGEYLTPAK